MTVIIFFSPSGFCGGSFALDYGELLIRRQTFRYHPGCSDIGKFILNSKYQCTVRVGIHVGPVIAGVIGSKKFCMMFAVNTAQRKQSTSELRKIQASEKFYHTIKTDFIVNTGVKPK